MTSMYNEHYTTADRLASPTMATCEGCGTKYTMHTSEVPAGKRFFCTNFPPCAEKRAQEDMGDFKVSEFGYEGDPNEIMGATAQSDVNQAVTGSDTNEGLSISDPNASDVTAPKDADGNPVPPKPPINETELIDAPGTVDESDKPDYVENHDVATGEHDVDGIDTPTPATDDFGTHQIGATEGEQQS